MFSHQQSRGRRGVFIIFSLTLLVGFSPLKGAPAIAAKGSRDAAANARQQEQSGKKEDRDHGHPSHQPPKPPPAPKPPRDCNDELSPPTGVVATAVSMFQVNVSWQDTSSNEAGYKIERSLDGTNFTQIAQVLPNTTVYRDGERFPGTKYYYRVRSFDARSTSAGSSVVCAQTPEPECPLSVAGNAPMPVAMDNAVAVAAGGDLSVILKSDRTVLCWQNETGLLDNRATALSNIVAIAAGATHCVALRADGTVFAWGANDFGQLNVPVGLSNVVKIAAGHSHNLALKSDGTVVAWGDNVAGQLNVPNELRGVVAVAAGFQHSLALLSDGQVITWGSRLSQPIGALDWLSNVVAVAGGYNLGIGLHADGRVSTWGYDWRQPEDVPGDVTNATAVAVGDVWNIALRPDKTYRVWGTESFFGMPATELTGVVAFSLHGVRLLVLTEVPGVAKDLTLKIIAPDRMGLTWQTSRPEPKSLVVQRAINPSWTSSPSGPQLNANWEDIATLSGGSTSFEDRAVVTNQAYAYQIVARNACGTGRPSIHRQVLMQPSNLLGLGVRAFAGSAQLTASSWESGTVDFVVEHSTDPNGLLDPWQTIAVLPATNESATFVHTGLTLGSLHCYRVKGRNGLGESEFSPVQTVMISLPTAPIGLALRAGNTNQVLVSWGSPVGDDSGFVVERAEDLDGFSGPWATVGVLTNGDAREFADSVSRDSGKTWWYRVRSFNVLGDSEYSLAASIRLERSAPPLISAQNVGTTVSVSWSSWMAASGSRFELQRTEGVVGVPENWKTIAVGTNNFNGGSFYSGYSDLGRQPGQTYRYRVRISDWLGESDFSDSAQVTIGPPAALAIYSIGVHGSNTVALSWWLYSLGNHATVFIDRAPDFNQTPGTWSEIGKVTLDAVSSSGLAYFFDRNAMARATYWYRLRAVDASGTAAPGEPLRFPVRPPATISSVSAFSHANSVLIDWRYTVSPSQIDGFKIYRSPDVNGTAGGWSQVGSLATPVRSALQGYQLSFRSTNSDVSVGKYWYRIVSYSWAGESEPADAWVEVEPPSAGVDLVAIVGQPQQVSLRWNPPYQDESDGVEIERAPDTGSAPGPWSQLARIYRTNNAYVTDAYPTAPHFVVTNIAANMTNWFRLRVFNALGYSAYLGPVAARTSLPPPVPEFVLARNEDSGVEISWSIASRAYISDFEIQRAPDDNGVPGAWLSAAFMAGGELSEYFYRDTNADGQANSWYRVRSRDAWGVSDFSAPVRAFTPTLYPPQIASLSIASTNQVRLNFYPSSVASGGNRYQIERAFDDDGVPGEWQIQGRIFQSGWGMVSFIDTNVPALSNCWYRVRTFNSLTTSEPTVAQKIQVIPPSPPNSFTRVFNSRATITWYPEQYDYYGSVIGVSIERAPDAGGAPGDWVKVRTVPLGVLGRPSYFTDVLPMTNAAYWYRLQAFNWIGAGDYRTNYVEVKPPSVPQSVSAGAGASNQIRLSWYSGYPADQQGFKIERAPDVGGVAGSFMTIASFADSSSYRHDFADVGVVPGTTNWYRVRAYNALGDSLPSAEVPGANPKAAVFVLPLAPQIESIVVTNNDVLISWRGGAGRTYVVEAASGLGGTFTAVSSGIALSGVGNAATNFLEPKALTNGPSRFYRIREQ